MPKVICTLPNASEEISGVKFVSHGGGGMISEDISEEQAARFASISGYELVSTPAKSRDPEAEELEAEELAELTKHAEDIGVRVDPRWKALRLKSEIEKAEKAKAKAAAEAAKENGDKGEAGGANDGDKGGTDGANQ